MALLIYSAVWFLFCLGALTGTEGGKLLVVPMDGSHWLSMSSVVERLAQNGHEIIVAKPENSIVKFGSQHFTLRNFPTAYSNQDIHELLQQFFGSQFSSSSVIEVALTTYNGILSVQNMMNSMCESLLHNKQFIQKLQEEKFDAVLNDPMFFCGVILAEHLGIPSVNFLRGVPCMYDYISAQCDSPLSYVPRPFAQNSDKMNFLQRLGNTLFWLSEPVFCGAAFRGWERVASEFLQKKVTAIELLSRTSIWLMRYDFVFEHPRPMMPNMVFIGGINCAGRKPLSQEFEKLVNSSGEHGFVVFSLGSMVSEIPINKATDIAEALKSIPQQVLWRYTGKTPPNLGENTHLVKWLPQNDLLAHPKARAFITHAGSHGIYEGICNAVPMVMLPLFGDQMDNAKRIESRGAGLTLNVLHMTSEDLSNAVKAVINNPVYKENIQRLSSLHLDRPVHPLDLAVHWVEFVMRHKGAPHLRPAAHDLNWFQYYSLDVIGFLMFFLLTTLFISLKCCTFVFRRCCKRSSKQKPKSKSQ
ncbi:UDP-glucuronosyltransferase 1A1 isoform X2 [Xenopus laevis]|uniref:UDP-glucuronosyltransferase n=1 Tax=Xenopus laevis TaxID=8355 RepID=A0A8J1LTS4_XENLA|nr:UDP-glucuronosyltransferase 1A1 isoform X2 [Xenopus laevis]